MSRHKPDANEEFLFLGRSVTAFILRDLKAVMIGAVTGALIIGLTAHFAFGWSLEGSMKLGIVAGAFFGLLTRSVMSVPFDFDRQDPEGRDGS
jgi:hypothetical protein